jgi:hypothetical protein
MDKIMTAAHMPGIMCIILQVLYQFIALFVAHLSKTVPAIPHEVTILARQ